MNPDQVVTIVVGVAQSGAAGIIVWALIRGLKLRIDSLQRTIGIQSDTIAAMEKRVGEAEKIGDLYKGLVRDLPSLLESLSKGKDQIIMDLRASIEHREKAQPDHGASDSQKKEDRSILVTMRSMLMSERNELTRFAQSIVGNIDTAAVLLSRTKSFDDFVQSAGARIQFENDAQKFKEIIQSSDPNINPTGVRHASQSIGGFYGVCGDKRVIINSAKYHDLKAMFDQLKLELETLR